MVRTGRLGQSLIEAALVAVVFLSLVLTLVDVAQITFVRATLAERARSAARWAAVRPYDEASTRNMVLYFQSTAPSGAGSGLLGLTSGNVQVNRLGGGDGRSLLRVAVVNYHYAGLSPWLARITSRVVSEVIVPME
jgi:Flp pilus assembly protein TadG